MRQKVKMIIVWLWNERTRISKYLISGFSAFAIDWGTYAICTRALHFNEYVANILSVLLGATCAFLANKYWSFNRRENTVRQSQRFVLLAICNYAFQQFGFVFALSMLHINDLIAKVLLIGMMVSWNFLLYKYWVYAVEV